MSLFSNDIRVANTATPSFQQQANVGQFGWTGADQGHYNQLIQYVDECRKIWLGLEEKIEYVENLLLEVADIDEQVRYVTQKANEVAEDARQTTVDVARTTLLYREVKTATDNFNLDYADFATKYNDFFVKYPETLDAALSASISEVGAKEWHDKSKDLYDDLKEGQVYRGTWNPKTNAYPDNGGTNSVWDVILDDGTLEFDFGGHKWRAGDRLIYIVSSASYDRLATGSGVTSVNGEVGAVTLTADKVGALGKTANAVSATKLVTPRTISGVTFDGTSNIVLGPAEVRSVPLDRKINNKLLSADVTLTAADVGSLPITGGTLGGSLAITSSNNLVTLYSPAGAANYILGRVNNVDHWYVGKGSTSIDDIVLRASIHDTSLILRANEVTANKKLVVQTSGGGLWVQAPVATDPSFVISQVAGANNWYVGKGGASDEVALSSYKTGANITLKSDRISCSKDLYVNTYKVYHQGYKPTAYDIQVSNPKTKRDETLFDVIASLVSRIEELEAKLK